MKSKEITGKGKVCLDAGHAGKYNQSPAVPQYYESDMTWKLHLLLMTELEKYGIEVILTRENQETDKRLSDRGRCSEGCDLFLSIHSNAVDGKVHEQIDHPLVIVMQDGRGDALGKVLTKLIEETMQTNEKGRIYKRENPRGGEWYGVLQGADEKNTIGMILEHSFHSCTKSAKWLMEEENLKTLAEKEAAAIAGWLADRKHPEYSRLQFVRDIQKSLGVEEDGIPGPVTLGATVTVSAEENSRHPCVKFLQKRLNALGYTQAGPEDGIAGAKFTAAVAAYQADNGCWVDGEITRGNLTWKKLLGMA